MPSVAQAVGLSWGPSSSAPAVYWSLPSSTDLSCMPLSADLILQNLGTMTFICECKMVFTSPSPYLCPVLSPTSPLLSPLLPLCPLFYEIQRFEKMHVNWVWINSFSMMASGSTCFLVNNIMVSDWVLLQFIHTAVLSSTICWWARGSFYAFAIGDKVSINSGMQESP